MGRPAVVDLAGLLRSHAGGSAIRRRWHDGVVHLAPLHTQLRAAGFPAALPDIAKLAPTINAVGRARGELAVIGQPGVVGAVRAWNEAVGAGEGVRYVSSPPTRLEVKRVFAFLGPAWVESLVEQAIEQGARVAVCGVAEGDEQVEPPPKGWFVADNLAGDGRLGSLSAGVLTAAGVCGVNIEEALAGASETLTVLDGPAGTDNPGWSLARAIRLAAQELGRDSVVHVAGNSALLSFASWAARVHAGTVVGEGGGGHLAARPLPAVVESGDEEWLEALVSGSRNRLLICWEPGHEPALEPWMQFVLSSGQAAIRIRIPAVDAYGVGSAMALWLRTVACLSLLEDRELRGLTAAFALRAAARTTA